MTIHAQPGQLDGILLLQPDVHHDARGYFTETYRKSDYDALGLPAFVQDNLAVSRRGVLRGLHTQQPNAQAKLVNVLHGTIYDVAVDLRPDSPSFGTWQAVELSGDRPAQLYIPAGFAHGYQVLSERAVVAYRCSRYYDPASEVTLSWRDPELDIPWPIAEPVCSARDLQGRTLSEIRESIQPVLRPGTR